MNYVCGADRNQINVLPETLDDYVDENNICRVIDAFVDSLDFAGMEFKHAQLAETGRPPYAPAVLSKLYLYGMLNRVRSSRRLHTETLRNVEVMWLLNKQTPDDRTICYFRKNNAKAIVKIFREFNKFCLKCDLFSRETAAVDGSKFRANNNRRNIFTRANVTADLAEIEKKLNEKAAEYLEELEKNDASEPTDIAKINEGGVAEAMRELNAQKRELREIIEVMDKNDENQFSTNDPDSRLMIPGGDGREFDARYNVQMATDVKNSLIVDFEVTNDCNDKGHFEEMTRRAMEVMEVDKLNGLGDKGYYDGDDIVKCEENGVACYIAKPDAAGTSHKGLRLEKFVYDKATDTYTCPMKQTLEFSYYQKVDGVPSKLYTSGGACARCVLKSLCTKNPQGRVIIRGPNQDLLDSVDMRTAKNPELYKKRGQTVEHPFGTIKAVWGYRNFLCKGFEMVSAEMALTCLAYNFRRAVNIFASKNQKMCFD